MDQTVSSEALSGHAGVLARCVAWAISFRRTIRGHILVSFLLMSAITAGLGGYAVLSISRAGELVAKTFDQSLMSINHARSAAADFSSMRAAFARRWIASDPEMRAQFDESVDAWRRSLAEDLEVAAQRSQSKRAAQAAFNVQRAAINWNEVRLRLISYTPTPLPTARRCPTRWRGCCAAAPTPSRAARPR